MYEDEDLSRYPRAWGKQTTYVRIKASTFICMLVGDLIAFLFILLVLMGV